MKRTTTTTRPWLLSRGSVIAFALKHVSLGAVPLAAVSLAVLSLATASPAHAAGKSKAAKRRVGVRVVEVAGGRAYLSPGADKHLQIGDEVRIGRTRFAVIAVNRKNVVVALGDARLRRGQRGFVRVTVEKSETAQRREAPAALASFEGVWLEPSRPADAQTPKPVALGVMRDPRQNRAWISLDHFRIVPLSGTAATIGRTRVRARLHAEPWGPTVTFDADGFAETWQASDLDRRPGNASRPLVRLNQLELGYRGELVEGSLGRLRYASSTLGMLDGARVTSQLGAGLEASAFGGSVPTPIDSGFGGEATRFGTELSWSDEGPDAYSRALLSLSGSSYDGNLDERRVTGAFESYPGFGHLAARAEVSLFDADNPWGASTTELTAAGADVSVQLDSLRLGASAEMRRPERSRYLMALLPPGYFCVAEPQAGMQASEACIGGDRRHSGSLNASWEQELWTMSAGVMGTATRRARAEQLSAYLSGSHRKVWGPLRADAGLSASSGSLLDSAGLQIGAGGPFASEDADVSLYYRPRVMRYRTNERTFVEHGMGVRLWWTALTDVDLGLSADAVVGRDVDVAYLHGILSWRPRF